MSDLGTQALLQADLDAKVTTNAPLKENTGTRVRAFLTNFIDTLYALIGRDRAPTAIIDTTSTDTSTDPGQNTIRFNHATGSSVTEIALNPIDAGGDNKGNLYAGMGGILQGRTVGTTTTFEYRIVSVVHTTFTVYTVVYLKGVIPADNAVVALRWLPLPLGTSAGTVAEGSALAAKAESSSLGVAETKAVYDYCEGVTGSGDGTVQVFMTSDQTSGGTALYTSVVILSATGYDNGGVNLVCAEIVTEDPTNGGSVVRMVAGNPDVEGTGGAFVAPADNRKVRVFFKGIKP